MTTKPPSPVSEFPADSLEKIAYASVSSVPTVEPNDRNRLGYHIWRWLTRKQGTLEQAIHESGSRMKIAPAEALKIISQELEKQGIKVR
jgi:hypothetical protein